MIKVCLAVVMWVLVPALCVSTCWYTVSRAHVWIYPLKHIVITHIVALVRVDLEFTYNFGHYD